MATIVPAIVIFVFLNNKSIFRINTIFYLFLFFSLALLVFLYLPIRAFQNPPIDWANPTNLSRFIDCIMVKFAQKKMFNLGLLKFFTISANHLLLLFKQFLIFGFISIFGLYCLKKINSLFFIFLFVVIIINTLTRSEIQNF